MRERWGSILLCISYLLCLSVDTDSPAKFKNIECFERTVQRSSYSHVACYLFEALIDDMWLHLGIRDSFGTAQPNLAGSCGDRGEIMMIYCPSQQILPSVMGHAEGYAERHVHVPACETLEEGVLIS